MAKRLTRDIMNKQKPRSEAYHQALRLYWQGEKESTIALISDHIGEGTLQHPELFYRLWIEILADEKDEASLRALQSHISKSIDYKNPSWVSLLSLVGLVHYEIGELEAAQLVFRSMSKHHRNPYCKELQWVASQPDPHTQGLFPLNMTFNSWDYTHFKRAALAAKRNLDEKSFMQIRRDMRNLFGNHPLMREIKFHEYFGMKEFRKACLIAKSLRQSYPTHTEYQFYFAYTASKIARNKVALQEFLQLNRRLHENDSDVLCAISSILLTESDKSISQSNLSKSKNYLRRAAEKLNKMGLSAAYPRTLLTKLENNDIEVSGKCWFIKLTAKQTYELYNRPLDKIEYLQRPMGEYVQQGDTCFFVSESQTFEKDQPGNWRLLAIYQAVSNPEWHPLHRWQTNLHLQIRLDVSLPIENMGQRCLSVKGSDRLGIFGIEPPQLLRLEHGIKEFVLDDESYQPIFEHWRRLIS